MAEAIIAPFIDHQNSNDGSMTYEVLLANQTSTFQNSYSERSRLSLPTTAFNSILNWYKYARVCVHITSISHSVYSDWVEEGTVYSFISIMHKNITIYEESKSGSYAWSFTTNSILKAFPNDGIFLDIGDDIIIDVQNCTATVRYEIVGIKY